MSSSCLTMKLKFPRAKKVWKSFTSKLKIIRLIRSSKASRSHNNNKLPYDHQIVQHRRRSYKKAKKRRFGLFKRRLISSGGSASAPVYIDKLFKEPAAAEMILDQIQLPSFVKNCNKIVVDEEDEEAGTNSVGDDMWESLGFASPLLRGVVERAEEFIARFRAEMELQEDMVRNL